LSPANPAGCTATKGKKKKIKIIFFYKNRRRLTARSLIVAAGFILYILLLHRWVQRYYFRGREAKLLFVDIPIQKYENMKKKHFSCFGG
jgi:hypothetical protein